MLRTSNMVRTFLSDQNSVSGSRSKKPEKHNSKLNSIKLFISLFTGFFGSIVYVLCLGSLSLCGINHCYRYIRSQCPFQSAQICSKFLLLSFRIPSIFTRFLSRAEPPRETRWSWLYNKYLQIIHKGKKYQKGTNLSFLTTTRQPAQPATRSFSRSMAVTSWNKQMTPIRSNHCIKFVRSIFIFNHIKTLILARVLILNKGQASKPNKPIIKLYICLQ